MCRFLFVDSALRASPFLLLSQVQARGSLRNDAVFWECDSPASFNNGQARINLMKTIVSGRKNRCPSNRWITPSWGILLMFGHASSAAILDTNFNASANNTVYAVAVQPADQKILIGGAFDQVNGAAHYNIARLNTDGTTDTGFTTGLDGVVNVIVVQADNKILIGGSFTEINGTDRAFIGRLNADGTTDTAFAKGMTLNGSVLAIAPQSDGRIIIGGTFTMINGGNYPRLGRLLSNGALDTSYGIGYVSGPVYALALHPADGTTNAGKVYVAGDFQFAVGYQRLRVARLMPYPYQAWLDTSFGTATSGANGTVKALTVYLHPGTPNIPKILIGGAFTQVNSENHNKVARLELNGLPDMFWNGSSLDNTVNTMAIDLGSSPLMVTIGGDFTSVEGFVRRSVARLNLEQGTVAFWNTGTGAGGTQPTVESLAIQNDGKVVIGGSFTLFEGQTRNRIARLHHDEQ